MCWPGILRRANDGGQQNAVRCRDLTGNATVDTFSRRLATPGSGMKRVLTVGTSLPAAGTSAAADTSAAGRSWGARRSPAGGSLAASSPSVSRNVLPGPRLRQLRANARVRTRGSERLAMRAVSCVAFEELEAHGKAREPRSAGQRRRVVRNGRPAGAGGRDRGRRGVFLDFMSCFLTHI